MLGCCDSQCDTFVPQAPSGPRKVKDALERLGYMTPRPSAQAGSALLKGRQLFGGGPPNLHCVCHGSYPDWHGYVQCSVCKCAQHRGCLTDLAYDSALEYVCPRCQLHKFLAFGEIQSTLLCCLKPVSYLEFELPFHLYSLLLGTPRWATCIHSPGLCALASLSRHSLVTAACSYKVMLVGCIFSDPVVRPMYPPDAFVHLNHYEVSLPYLDAKTRKRPTSQQPPVDITNLMVAGRNTLTYVEGCATTAFSVAVVRLYEKGEAARVVKSKRVLSAAIAKACFGMSVSHPTRCSIRQVKAKLQEAENRKGGASQGAETQVGVSEAGAGAGGGTAAAATGTTACNGGGSEDDDDIVVATGVQLPLKDPLSLTPIVTPARGIDCRHAQCFDLDVYLSFYNKPTSKYRCPFCQVYVSIEDLWVDPVVSDVLQCVRDHGAKGGQVNSEGAARFVAGRSVPVDDVASIEVNADGSWKAVVPEVVTAGSHHEGGSSAGANAASATATPSRKRKRPPPAAPPVIVSLLSDSEDDVAAHDSDADLLVALLGEGMEPSPTNAPPTGIPPRLPPNPTPTPAPATAGAPAGAPAVQGGQGAGSATAGSMSNVIMEFDPIWLA